MKKKKPNMQQIADALSITPITVSRALGDKAGVSDELRQQIKDYAQNIGYSPEPRVKKTSPSRPIHILLLVAEVFMKTNNKMYFDFYKSILKQLEEKNIFGSLKLIEEKEVTNGIIPKMLLDSLVDGIIVLGELESAYITKLNNLSIPLILVDFYDENLSLDAVINDNFFESYEITRYLIANGHTNIAFVGNINSTHSIQDRYLGYYKALLRFDLPIEKHTIISDRKKNGYFFEELALPTPLPSAFVCNCDEIAYRLIKQLQASGLRVPEDCSVVSFDNSKFCTQTNPQITTMASNLDEMVKTSITNLLNKIQNPALHTGVISVKGSLIERESVKKMTKSPERSAKIFHQASLA